MVLLENIRRLSEQGLGNVGLQEAFDHDVAEWLALLESFRSGRRIRQALIRNHACATVIACP